MIDHAFKNKLRAKSASELNSLSRKKQILLQLWIRGQASTKEIELVLQAQTDKQITPNAISGRFTDLKKEELIVDVSSTLDGFTVYQLTNKGKDFVRNMNLAEIKEAV